MFYIFLLLLLLIVLYLEFRPLRKIKINEQFLGQVSDFPENIKKYNVIAHIHTQFSFDSLGKPSDIKKAMEENNIDFVFVTDHDNDNYRFFEDERVFAGVEKNTPEGRLLLLGNELPVISHPNNFEFEHYRWKGEFKPDHLYEIIDIKDGIVWNKPLAVVSLIKNILILPLTRDILHKWNALIPLESWSRLYYARARGLKIIGGLDLHVKLVYQEHTHGILIPSYRSGFRWLVNRVYSKNDLRKKGEVLEALKKGNLFLALKNSDGDFWVSKDKDVFLLGEKVPLNSLFNVVFDRRKTVKIIKHENRPVAVTQKNRFSFLLDKKGFYHIEVYEYDIKVGSLFFGFRPLVITNPVEVCDV